MSAFVRQLLLLGCMTALGFALYVLLFWLGVGASVTILFYRGVVLALVASVVVGIASAGIGRRVGDSSLAVAAAALSLSFNICFLVLLPVTVDRSVSVYLLSTIDRQQEDGTNAAQLQQAFMDGYVVKMGAIDRRIDEQQKSGNIAVSRDGKVRLTEQGQRFMKLSRFISRLFGTDPRFVEGYPAAKGAPTVRSTLKR